MSGFYSIYTAAEKSSDWLVKREVSAGSESGLITTLRITSICSFPAVAVCGRTMLWVYKAVFKSLSITRGRGLLRNLSVYSSQHSLRNMYSKLLVTRSIMISSAEQLEYKITFSTSGSSLLDYRSSSSTLVRGVAASENVSCCPNDAKQCNRSGTTSKYFRAQMNNK